MEFFYPDGTEIKGKNAREQFIKIYSCNYYSDFEKRLKEFFGDDWDQYNLNSEKYDQIYSDLGIKSSFNTIQSNETAFEEIIDSVLAVGFCSEEAKRIIEPFQVRDGYGTENDIKKHKGIIPSSMLMICLCLAWKTQKVSLSNDIITFKAKDRNNPNGDPKVCIIADDECIILDDRFREMRLNNCFFCSVKQAIDAYSNYLDTVEKQMEIMSRYTTQFQNIKNLGPTYALALWFFVTKGHAPIYDKYADYALSAIMNHNRIGDIVQYKAIETYNKQRVYNRYLIDLTTVFGWNNSMSDKERRDIDRALWVYGHLFKS